jgi:beta-glucosidase-like glycosyl hydrolase
MTIPFTDLKAIVIDATGTELSKEEQQLFKSERPAGFILFKRNCVSKNQVKDASAWAAPICPC